MTMFEKLKSLGFGVLGLIAITAMLFLVGLLIGGASWLSNHLLPWFMLASTITFIVLILILLPLSAFRHTRSFAAVAILYASFLFGVTVWMDGLLTTEALWGTWAVIVGLCFAGVGIVPIGMLAALFHGKWSVLGELIVFTVLTFASRFYAIWLGEHDERALQKAESTFFLERSPPFEEEQV
jgi:hypothetical protein